MTSIVRRHTGRALIVAAIALTAASAVSMADQSTGPAPDRGPLDGMIFVGKIGPQDKPDLSDELHFNNGQFWSKICTRCGFQPGPYQASSSSGGIKFQGELRSTSRGRFVYSGRIKNNSIKVSISWTKQRWYWTASRDLVFEGTLAPARIATPVSAAQQLTAAAKPNRLAQCSRF